MIISKAISKIILSGEHAVVHGYPAVSLPVFNCSSQVTISNHSKSGIEINAPQISTNLFIEKYKADCNPLELTVTNFLRKFELSIPNISIEITSNIPIASGMGSGASISTAIIRGLAEYFKIEISTDEIYNQVFEIEKIYHGNPSGIDPKVIVYQAPFYFVKDTKMEEIKIKKNLEFVIIDSKIRSTTKEVVELVEEQYKLYPAKYKTIFSHIANISNNLKSELEEDGNIHYIGDLLNSNHNLLRRMGVSNQTLDEIVKTCLESGALGAKLSGAGKGGIVIALVASEQKDYFVKDLKQKGITDICLS